MEFLRVDSQFSVVEAALKGYMKWADNNALEPVLVSLIETYVLPLDFSGLTCRIGQQQGAPGTEPGNLV